MTRDAVQAAVRQLEANGEKVTARRVRKLLGGGSFRDLLPLLQNQSHSPDDQPSDPLYQRMLDLVETLDGAIVQGRPSVLHELLAEADTWRPKCMFALLAAGARGEPTDAWTAVYERIGGAMARARGRLATPAKTPPRGAGWIG